MMPAEVTASPPATRRGVHRPWGRLQPSAARVVDAEASAEAIQAPGPVLPFGNGRSYGDVCMNGAGTLVDCRPLNRILAFDTERGILRAEAGVLLSEVLEHIVPHGWFLPVSPGTKFITLGGAIANDVHGKNHHGAGTFGCHVPRLELARSDGSRIVCGPDEEEEWFAATVGGLGLTGLILWAEVQLIPIHGRGITVRSTAFDRLGGFFDLAAGADRDHVYTVAWIDCMARGANLGRGRMMTGDHTGPGDRQPSPRRFSVDFFVQPPFSLVNSLSVRIFNAVYYGRPGPRTRVTDYEPFFYPLDAVRNWNRMYGPRGFYQFQCVVPQAVGEAAIRELLVQTGRHGQGSFLAVLKQFGELPSPGLLSFPRPGPTLALDFPNRGESTRRLLATLERVTMEAGGALYPAKDACMTPETFERSFPRWRELEARRDPAFDSDFWRRVRAGLD
jgi:FAD/FMN-containing dehydrogenase